MKLRTHLKDEQHISLVPACQFVDELWFFELRPFSVKVVGEAIGHFTGNLVPTKESRET